MTPYTLLTTPATVKALLTAELLALLPVTRTVTKVVLSLGRCIPNRSLITLSVTRLILHLPRQKCPTLYARSPVTGAFLRKCRTVQKRRLVKDIVTIGPSPTPRSIPVVLMTRRVSRRHLLGNVLNACSTRLKSRLFLPMQIALINPLLIPLLGCPPQLTFPL